MDDRIDDAWRQAKKRNRLTDDDVRKAKELGFQPAFLSAPVSEWVRTLYEEKFGARKPEAIPASAPPGAAPGRPGVIEFRNPDQPWPDNPEIPERPVRDLPVTFDDEEDPEFADLFGSRKEPSEEDVKDENAAMLLRQRRFRWAAQSIAIAMSELPEVQKVAAFGAVAAPLEMEVPRFRDYRRYGIEILHECQDLDLAVWMTDFKRLKELKRAMNRGLSPMQNTPFGGVAHHQVDVHILDAGTGDYRGRLCIFSQCPKEGRRECLAPGCGAELFLQQFAEYRFRPGQFADTSKTVLFDRAARFVVRKPRVR